MSPLPGPVEPTIDLRDPTPPTPGPVILLVDDDPVLGHVVAACLDFEGAQVRTAHTVAEGRIALDPSLDHVVLDRRLPDGDGLELLEDLAVICPDVPVVVCSASDDPDGTDVPHVAKADIATLVELLGLEPEDHRHRTAPSDPHPIPTSLPFAAGDDEGL